MGAQALALQAQCQEDKGGIVHELMHALGFHHEQVRDDVHSLNSSTQFDLFILRIYRTEPTGTISLESTWLRFQSMTRTSSSRHQAKRTPPLTITNLSCTMRSRKDCKYWRHREQFNSTRKFTVEILKACHQTDWCLYSRRMESRRHRYPQQNRHSGHKGHVLPLRSIAAETHI